nr:pVIII [Tern adenovirus]
MSGSGVQPVTPYLWSYQPATGKVAGARQDYGSVINWFSADSRLCDRIKQVNINRNNIDRERANVNRHDNSLHFNDWESYEILQPHGMPYIPASKTTYSAQNQHDFIATSNGEQLSGPSYKDIRGGSYAVIDGREYRKLTRDNLPFPYNWQVKTGNEWVSLQGTGTNKLSSYPNFKYAELQPIEKYARPGQQLQGSGVPMPHDLSLLFESSRVPRSDSISTLQFMRDFPPVVYEHPFSENLAYFPKEFNPLFVPENDYRRTSNLTLKYK